MSSVPFCEWTREEKDEFAKSRMDKMKLLNEKFKQRHAEVEQDRIKAEEEHSSVTRTPRATLRRQTKDSDQDKEEIPRERKKEKIREWDEGKADKEHWSPPRFLGYYPRPHRKGNSERRNDRKEDSWRLRSSNASRDQRRYNFSDSAPGKKFMQGNSSFKQHESDHQGSASYYSESSNNWRRPRGRGFRYKAPPFKSPQKSVSDESKRKPDYIKANTFKKTQTYRVHSTSPSFSDTELEPVENSKLPEYNDIWDEEITHVQQNKCRVEKWVKSVNTSSAWEENDDRITKGYDSYKESGSYQSRPKKIDNWRSTESGAKYTGDMGSRDRDNSRDEMKQDDQKKCLRSQGGYQYRGNKTGRRNEYRQRDGLKKNVDPETVHYRWPDRNDHQNPDKAKQSIQHRRSSGSEVFDNENNEYYNNGDNKHKSIRKYTTESNDIWDKADNSDAKVDDGKKSDRPRLGKQNKIVEWLEKSGAGKLRCDMEEISPNSNNRVNQDNRIKKKNGFSGSHEVMYNEKRRHKRYNSDNNMKKSVTLDFSEDSWSNVDQADDTIWVIAGEEDIISSKLNVKHSTPNDCVGGNKCDISDPNDSVVRLYEDNEKNKLKDKEDSFSGNDAAVGLCDANEQNNLKECEFQKKILSMISSELEITDNLKTGYSKRDSTSLGNAANKLLSDHVGQKNVKQCKLDAIQSNTDSSEAGVDNLNEGYHEVCRDFNCFKVMERLNLKDGCSAGISEKSATDSVKVHTKDQSPKNTVLETHVACGNETGMESFPIYLKHHELIQPFLGVRSSTDSSEASVDDNINRGYHEDCKDFNFLEVMERLDLKDECGSETSELATDSVKVHTKDQSPKKTVLESHVACGDETEMESFPINLKQLELFEPCSNVERYLTDVTCSTSDRILLEMNESFADIAELSPFLSETKTDCISVDDLRYDQFLFESSVIQEQGAEKMVLGKEIKKPVDLENSIASKSPVCSVADEDTALHKSCESKQAEKVQTDKSNSETLDSSALVCDSSTDKRLNLEMDIIESDVKPQKCYSSNENELATVHQPSRICDTILISSNSSKLTSDTSITTVSAFCNNSRVGSDIVSPLSREMSLNTELNLGVSHKGVIQSCDMPVTTSNADILVEEKLNSENRNTDVGGEGGIRPEILEFYPPKFDDESNCNVDETGKTVTSASDKICCQDDMMKSIMKSICGPPKFSRNLSKECEKGNENSVSSVLEIDNSMDIGDISSHSMSSHNISDVGSNQVTKSNKELLNPEINECALNLSEDGDCSTVSEEVDRNTESVDDSSSKEKDVNLHDDVNVKNM